MMAGIQVVNKTDKVVEVAGQKVPAKTSIVIHKSFFKEEELKKVKNGMIIVGNKPKSENKDNENDLTRLNKKQLISKLKELGVNEVNENIAKDKLIEMIENIQAKG